MSWLALNPFIIAERPVAGDGGLKASANWSIH
jgi:hypothetical protein